MKVLLVNGSPRRAGNTAALLKEIGRAFHAPNDVVLYHDLIDMDVRDCIGCMKCKRSDACALDDDMTALYNEIREADAIVVGSPIYVGAETGITKCFLDRIYALLAPGNGPQGVVTRLAPGKKAFALFPCRRKNGAELYSNMVYRYHEAFGALLGMEVKVKIMPEVHVDMDVLQSPIGRRTIDECLEFLTSPRPDKTAES